ncbi:aminoacyl-tRNA hydrolase [Methylococcus sp. EFPC2]|uniref:aminoacyl-tRNA hydrolase n=1 Tax=Methylococcus sp. EFPC2 TaxID=2812648 RepID=UPI0019688728|nr:aminoacyl-tRNA hydrolase [Methylococcus sp. EFPC2]QSA96354.1 aminoacyl-tRNA hydrolase [Methylococcus sp. EFPC2]
MAPNFRLLVGLGNPTAKYEKTRHNAGFWFLDEVARRYGVSMAADSRALGMVGKWMWQNEPVFLLKPMQYMNRSGGPVAAVARFYKIPPEQILVAHDELDFSPGTVRLKQGGGHGGHNGLRDIVSALGSANFCRLRIGIGHPGDRDKVADYVLDRPSRGDEDLLLRSIAVAADCLSDILDESLQQAMNKLHAA